MGTTGPRWAPCWPHEPCYIYIRHIWRTLLPHAFMQKRDFLQYKVYIWEFMRRSRRLHMAFNLDATRWAHIITPISSQAYSMWKYSPSPFENSPVFADIYCVFPLTLSSKWKSEAYLLGNSPWFSEVNPYISITSGGKSSQTPMYLCLHEISITTWEVVLWFCQ